MADQKTRKIIVQVIETPPEPPKLYHIEHIETKEPKTILFTGKQKQKKRKPIKVSV